MIQDVALYLTPQRQTLKTDITGKRLKHKNVQADDHNNSRVNLSFLMCKFMHVYKRHQLLFPLIPLICVASRTTSVLLNLCQLLVWSSIFFHCGPICSSSCLGDLQFFLPFLLSFPLRVAEQGLPCYPGGGTPI